jgi:hypothetical protein
MSAQAELEPISEKEMGKVHGQAVLAVDMTETEAGRLTRATIGMDVETMTKVKSLKMGDTGDGSDVYIDNLALGHYSDRNEFVPFEGISPYIELAEQDGELIGFRFGFNKARGKLSGDINSFSGKLGLELEDDEGNVSPATLFDAETVATNKRATYVGLDDPETDCATDNQCTKLTNLQTLDIGTRTGEGEPDGYTQNLFLAFQKQAVSWEANGDAPAIEAGPGVHLNLPTSMQLDMKTLQEGIPRAQTEYIESGQGIF